MKKTIIAFLLMMLTGAAVTAQTPCPAPTGLSVTNVSQNSATLTWTGTASVYVFQYRGMGSDEWQYEEVTTNTITLNQLNASMNYEAKVRSLCNTDTSDADSIVFRCNCGNISAFPYFEGFEVTGSSCWSTVGDGWEDGSNWEMMNATQYQTANSGSRLCFSHAITYGSSPNAYLISPAIQVPANVDGLYLTWYSRSTAGGNKYRVMVSTTTNSTDEFGTTLSNFTSDGNQWTEHVVSLDNYAGQTIYLAFWHYASAYSGGIAIDDIRIRMIEEPTVEIQGPEVVDINTDATYTAHLVMGASTGLAYSWSNVRSDAVMGADDSAQLHISYPERGYDTITLAVLNDYGYDTTTFVVYARDLSPVDEFPYSTGFEDGDDINWNSVGGLHQWYVGEDVASTGEYSMYVSHDGGATSGYLVDNNYNDGCSYTYAYRPFRFSQAGDYSLSFDWEGHGGFGTTGKVMLFSNLDNIQGDVQPNSSNYTLLADELDDEWNNTVWAHRDITFSITDTGVYYIAFCWYVEGLHGYSNAFAIDNIIVDRLGCSAVGNLTVDSVSNDYLSFSWTPNSGESNWLVRFNNGAETYTTDTFYVATGLTTATYYTFRVSALCDNGDTSDAVAITTMTSCTIIDSLPFSEDFNGYQSGTVIPCWDRLGTGDVYVGNGGVTGNALIFEPDGEADPFISVIPEIYVPINGLQISMSILPQNNFSGRLQVGYITDVNDASTFQSTLEVWADDCENAAGDYVYTPKTAFFTTAPAGARIAIRQDPWGSGRKYYIDDLEINTADSTYVDPTDPEQPCTTPTDLHITSLNITSAVIDWTSSNYVQEWELDLDGWIRTVDEHPYEFTGLVPGSEHSVRVRALCINGNYSEWSDSLVFTTLTCQPVTNVTVSAESTTSATVNWSAPNGGSTFEVEYGENGYAQGQGTLVTVESANSYTITGLTTGVTYQVRVRTACENDVKSEWSDKVSFTTEEPTGIDGIDNSSISLYPNPASSTVTIDGIDDIATVTVVDMNGRTAGQWTVAEGSVTIDVSQLAQGAYFVRIVSEQTNSIRKLIVK